MFEWRKRLQGWNTSRIIFAQSIMHSNGNQPAERIHPFLLAGMLATLGRIG